MQKYTIHAMLWTYQATSDGLFSIKIAVTVSRKVTYIATPFKVHHRQWDSKSRQVKDHSNAAMMNIGIKRLISDIERRLIDATLQGTQITKEIITGKVQRGKNFYIYASEVRHWQTIFNRMKTYAGPNLTLTDITLEWLRKFEQHERKRGLSENTMNTMFRYIGRIMRQAFREGYVQTDVFEYYRPPRYKGPKRVFLTEDEMKVLVKHLPETTGSTRITLAYFLLGCYTGLRHSDWCLFNYDKMVEGNFMRLTPKKNKSLVVLPIGNTLSYILSVVKEMPPPLTNQKSNSKLKQIAKAAGIKKSLTTHTARHSFGCLCASKGLPESTTAALMGISANVVKVYYHLTGASITVQAAPLLTV